MEIKETLELIDGVELLAVTGAEVMADGKIDSTDLGAAINLLSKSNIIVEAAKGIDMVDNEVKDLDQAELLQLGARAYEMIKKIKEAATKPV